MPSLYGGGGEAATENQPWRWELQLVDQNVYVSRQEKTELRSDDVIECDCRLHPGRTKGDTICNDERCLNFATFTECTPGRCSKACGNQRIRKGYWANTKVHQAGGKGHGLFLAEDVKAGTLVAEYTGEVINLRELNTRKKERRRDRHLFFLWLNQNEAIDATEKGGRARFVNHSCEPNCVAEKWKVGAEWRIGFFAMRNMSNESELTIDYSWDAAQGRKKTICLCGAPSCRGFIEKDDTMAVQQEETWSQIRGVVGTWRINRRDEGEVGEGLLNKRIRVFRPTLMRYIEGTVEGYDADTGLHQVTYVDGPTDKFNLATEKWQIWAEAENFTIKRADSTGEESEYQPEIKHVPAPPSSLEEKKVDEPVETMEIQVPFDAVGMIVGRAGDTIRKIIKETGVEDLSFNKATEKKSVQVANIKGTGKAVSTCHRRLQSIIKTFWAARSARTEAADATKEEEERKRKEEASKKEVKEPVKHKTKESLTTEVTSFDGRWCHGFSWQFAQTHLDEQFGSATSTYGARSSSLACIASPLLNRALDLIRDAGNRFPQVADTQLLRLHAAVIFLRYVAVRPKEEQTLALVDIAPACLFLAMKVYSKQVGGRALKDFFEITYACRYPGQGAPLVQSAGTGQGHSLTVEGKMWQEKVKECEDKVLTAMGLDIFFPDPFEMCRNRYLDHIPADLQPQAVRKAAEIVLSESANTTVWLKHDPTVIAVAASLVSQMIVHQVTTYNTRAPSLWVNDLSKPILKQYGTEVHAAATVLLQLEVSSPDFITTLASRITALINEHQEPANSLNPSRSLPIVALPSRTSGATNGMVQQQPGAVPFTSQQLSAETIPILPTLQHTLFDDEKTTHKVKTKYVKVKDTAPPIVNGLVWSRYLSGRLMLARWPNEKAAQREARLEGFSGFSSGFSPSALRELFVLQRLHHDAFRRKGCPYIVTPLAPVKGHAETAPAVSGPTPPPPRQASAESQGSPVLSIFDIMDRRKAANGPGISITSSNTEGPEAAPLSEPTPTRYAYLGLERVQYTLFGILRHTARDHHLGPALQRSLIRNLLDGVKWCHERGIILRSMDPNQIYLDRSGTVKLGCFDEAVLLPSKGAETIRHVDTRIDRVTAAKQMKEEWDEGKRRRKTLQAPEIILGGEPSRASDMWSTGCLVTMTLLGRPPFDASNARKLMEHVYRVVGSYDHSWKPGKSLPYYDLCRPQKHSGYACRIEKYVKEMVDAARKKRQMEVPDTSLPLLPLMIKLDPNKRATAAECLYAPYFSYTISKDAEARQAAWSRITSAVQPLIASSTAKPYALPDDSHTTCCHVSTYPSPDPEHLAGLFASSSLAPPPPPPTPAPSSKPPASKHSININTAAPIPCQAPLPPGPPPIHALPPGPLAPPGHFPEPPGPLPAELMRRRYSDAAAHPPRPSLPQGPTPSDFRPPPPPATHPSSHQSPSAPPSHSSRLTSSQTHDVEMDISEDNSSPRASHPPNGPSGESRRSTGSSDFHSPRQREEQSNGFRSPDGKHGGLGGRNRPEDSYRADKERGRSAAQDNRSDGDGNGRSGTRDYRGSDEPRRRSSERRPRDVQGAQSERHNRYRSSSHWEGHSEEAAQSGRSQERQDHRPWPYNERDRAGDQTHRAGVKRGRSEERYSRQAGSSEKGRESCDWQGGRDSRDRGAADSRGKDAKGRRVVNGLASDRDIGNDKEREGGRRRQRDDYEHRLSSSASYGKDAERSDDRHPRSRSRQRESARNHREHLGRQRRY